MVSKPVVQLYIGVLTVIVDDRVPSSKREILFDVLFSPIYEGEYSILTSIGMRNGDDCRINLEQQIKLRMISSMYSPGIQLCPSIKHLCEMDRQGPNPCRSVLMDIGISVSGNT